MKQFLVVLAFILGFSARAEILRAGDTIPNFNATTLEGALNIKVLFKKMSFYFFGQPNALTV
jgi:hypothetical protein